MISWLFDRNGSHEGLITDLRQVNSTWLTKVLKKSGFLEKGEVKTIHCELWKTTLLSNICRLTVGYSFKAPSSPSRLILKFSRSGFEGRRHASNLFRKEAEFYSVVNLAMGNQLAPICYDAIYRPDVSRAHLLLDDLSETHFHTKYPLPPSKLYSKQNVECLAKFHAYWWGDSRVGKDIGHIHNDECFQKRTRSMERNVTDFLDFLGDRLTDKRRKIYDMALSFHPSLQKLQQESYLTLVHGDAHTWNFLNPYHPDTASTRIIDWEFWSVDVGTNDLAFMIAVNWYPESRTILEKQLVKRYHDMLQSYGVKSYDWDDCWRDYRLSVIKHLFTPVLQWVSNPDSHAWWHNLERCMLAFSDLEFVELMKD